MKPTIIFLSGVVMALVGAFIRSCVETPAAFAAAWCGPGQMAQTQNHCPGCALLVAGLVIAAAAPFFIRRQARAVKGCC
jgi:hypothetical protein